MRSPEKVPTVNAGSTADIAFLLLIFFLVTTTIPNDRGIIRKLTPPCPPDVECSMDINERNILRISIGMDGLLLINNELIEMANLNTVLKKFIDNNGDASCQYCEGEQSKLSSDNPRIAIIALAAHRDSPYRNYIGIQDELTKAYHELRKKYAIDVLKTDPELMSTEELKQLQEAYPLRITEASTQ